VCAEGEGSEAEREDEMSSGWERSVQLARKKRAVERCQRRRGSGRSQLVNASRAFSGEGMLFSTGRGSTTHLKTGRVASATSSPHSSSSHSPLAQPLLVTSIDQRWT